MIVLRSSRAAFLAFLAGGAVLGLGCGRQEGQLVKLDPRHRVTVLRGGQVKFEKTGESAALVLYLTERQPGDAKGLEAEAQALFDHLKADIEKTGQTKAILQAEARPRGPLPGDKAVFGFLFEKQPDGSWARRKQ
ncbi:MAG: hypothetical protein HYZ13_13300 [Acidobacteria bacterium]|nr:hypothetical protein [Acidobacteriota bacterium]